MDAGPDLITPVKTTPCAASGSPLREAGVSPYMPSLRTASGNPAINKCYGDRFIPRRGSAMDRDVARYLLMEPNKDSKENSGTDRLGLARHPHFQRDNQFRF